MGNDHWKRALEAQRQAQAAAEAKTPPKLAPVTHITQAPSYLSRQFTKGK
jgi:hypothetical protein